MLGLIFIFLGVFAAWMLWPLGVHLREARFRLEQTVQEVVQKKALLKSVTALDEEERTLQQTVKDYFLFQNHFSSGEWTGNLTQMAQQTAVQVLSIQPQPSESDPHLERLLFSAEFLSSYQNWRAFLNRLYLENLPVWIEACRVEALPESRSLAALKIKVIFMAVHARDIRL